MPMGTSQENKIPCPTCLFSESRHQRHLSGDMDAKKRDTNLKRSSSAHSLKHLQDPSGHDDKLTILSQMFWIAVSLLETDYEYEFLLAVRLLDKVSNMGHCSSAEMLREA